MSRHAARDLRYGRRAGRWASDSAGRLLAELRKLRSRLQRQGEWPELVDLTRRFHPDTIAEARAHGRGGHDQAGPAVVDDEDLGAVWDGVARMARARRSAGQPLSVGDREALRRAKRSDQA